MTINAARLLGVDGERGTIRPGLAADIIAAPKIPWMTSRPCAKFLS